MLYVMESLMNFLGINLSLTLSLLYVLILDSDIFRGTHFKGYYEKGSIVFLFILYLYWNPVELI